MWAESGRAADFRVGCKIAYQLHRLSIWMPSLQSLSSLKFTQNNVLLTDRNSLAVGRKLDQRNKLIEWLFVF